MENENATFRNLFSTDCENNIWIVSSERNSDAVVNNCVGIYSVGCMCLCNYSWLTLKIHTVKEYKPDRINLKVKKEICNKLCSEW